MTHQEGASESFQSGYRTLAAAAWICLLGDQFLRLGWIFFFLPEWNYSSEVNEQSTDPLVFIGIKATAESPVSPLLFIFMFPHPGLALTGSQPSCPWGLKALDYRAMCSSLKIKIKCLPGDA